MNNMSGAMNNNKIFEKRLPGEVNYRLKGMNGMGRYNNQISSS